jgi:hypothetical protein
MLYNVKGYDILTRYLSVGHSWHTGYVASQLRTSYIADNGC